jgi:hypothetical protein
MLSIIIGSIVALWNEEGTLESTEIKEHVIRLSVVVVVVVVVVIWNT